MASMLTRPPPPPVPGGTRVSPSGTATPLDPASRGGSELDADVVSSDSSKTLQPHASTQIDNAAAPKPRVDASRTPTPVAPCMHRETNIPGRVRGTRTGVDARS